MLVLNGKFSPEGNLIKRKEYAAIMSHGEIIEAAKEEFEKQKKLGFESGLAEVREKYLKILEKFQSSLKDSLEKFQEEQAVLVFEIAKKILGEMDNAMEKVISSVLKRFDEEERIKIYCSSANAQLLQKKFKNFKKMEILASRDMDDLDCRIETKTGVINAGISDQLEQLKLAMGS